MSEEYFHKDKFQRSATDLWKMKTDPTRICGPHFTALVNPAHAHRAPPSPQVFDRRRHASEIAGYNEFNRHICGTKIVSDKDSAKQQSRWSYLIVV